MKHIFIDLDGTLLHNFSKVNEEDIVALHKAIALGCHISIATGRLDYEIQGFMKQFKINGHRISQNGGVVYDDQNQLIHSELLDLSDVKTILNAAKPYPLLPFVQTREDSIIEKQLPLIEEFEKAQHFLRYVVKEDIYETIEEHDVVSVSFWAEKNENLHIVEALKKVLPDHLAIYVSSEYTIDITHQLNSKGNGIKQLARLNDIPLENVFVIGDSYNDLSMFSITKNSYVMASADQAVKAGANYEVKSVKEAIELILK